MLSLTYLSSASTLLDETALVRLKKTLATLTDSDVRRTVALALLQPGPVPPACQGSGHAAHEHADGLAGAAWPVIGSLLEKR